jgi:hypothetical protein
MEIHFIREGTADTAGCGLPVLTAPPGAYFSTRHDQATCDECKASSPF